MAAVETSPAAPDVASFLAPADVPTKLRCAICNKLAVNAFRLPCCDQSICETCQSTLPASCPVCEHTPLSAEDCKPNKPLRTTITVFLRTEKKKRELVEQAESPRPSTPIVLPTLSAPPAKQSGAAASSLKEQDIQPDGPKGNSADSEEQRQSRLEDQLKESRNYSPVASNEPTDVISTLGKNLDVENAERAMEPEQQGGEKGGEQPAGQGGLKVGIEGQLGQWNPGQGQQQMMGAAGIGFDVSGVGFPNMGWNGPGDFQTMMNPVQPVMPNASWGSFPNAIGMPGMNVDPMAMSQGMYGGGFGGQGMSMSMSGMNMGVGMGFNAGHGGYDGWNGQSTWNGGHDKFNPNANGSNASGMVGDFGANTGYHPAAGGYNLQSHGNYSQIHQPQYQNNDYQDSFQGQGYFPRGGRGRGRGYSYGAHGRGSYGYGYDGNNTPLQQQLPQQYLQQPGDQVHHQPGFGNETNLLPNGTDDTSNSHALGSVTPKGPRSADGAENEMSEAKTLVETVVDTTPSETSKQTGEIETSRLEKSAPEPTATKSEVIAITTISMNLEPTAPSTKDSASPLAPISTYQGEHLQDFSGRGRGGNALRGPFRGSGEFRGNYRGRGGGFWSSPSGVVGHSPSQSSPTGQFPVAAPTEPKPVQGLGVPGAPSAPKALREGFPNRPRGRSGFGAIGRGGFEGRAGLVVPAPPASQSEGSAARPKSPSPSRSRSPESRQSNHRRHRHRSRSISDDESDRDQKHERRHHHPRKHRDDENGESDSKEDKVTSLQSSAEHSRSRSHTPERKSSHRSRHDKEKERRSSHRHRDSHRSHRERSRDRDRSRDRSKEGRRRRRRSRSPGDFDGAESAQPSQETADGDIKGEADTDRRRPKEPHSSRHHDRKPHTHSRRERSEPLAEDEADANEQDRRNQNRPSRRNGKADGANGPSNTARERDRDRPREPERNDRKNRGRDRDRERDRDRDDRDDRDNPRTATVVVEEDPHNREREERNRERLLKEQQRREELNKDRQRKDNERKRERLAEDDDNNNDIAGEGDEDRHRHRRHKHRHSRRRTMGGDEHTGVGIAADGPGKERQRRMSYKYEDEESDEARAQRVENEREAARWG
ncbi:MAG: hypothetical protein M1839_005212 [Geoglossum umbratile]|nr:MAG: hypothetical protein M1839_005212 [Geoglossum umbratile]